MTVEHPEDALKGLCPAYGCDRRTDVGRLLCGPCWHQVPPEVKKRVWAAWRDLSDGFPGAGERYREARDDAIASLR